MIYTARKKGMIDLDYLDWDTKTTILELLTKLQVSIHESEDGDPLYNVEYNFCSLAERVIDILIEFDVIEFIDEPEEDDFC